MQLTCLKPSFIIEIVFNQLQIPTINDALSNQLSKLSKTEDYRLTIDFGSSALDFKTRFLKDKNILILTPHSVSLGRSGDSEWRTWNWRSWRRWRRWRTLPRPTPPWSSPAPDLRQSTTSGQPRGTENTASTSSTASTQPRSGKLETLTEKCDHIDVNRRYLPETISIKLFVSRYIYFVFSKL